MNPEDNTTLSPSLAEQRKDVRMQLQKQRAVILLQLSPKTPASTFYPRSRTMRLLSQKPKFVAKLLLEVAGIVIGTRTIKSLIGAVGLVKMLRTSDSK